MLLNIVKKLKEVILLVQIIATMTGCETVVNMFTYKATTVAFFRPNRIFV